MIIPETVLILPAFVFGACIGSFLNVCIYRLPARQSIVTPRSACPHCQTPIRSYDNIPILSYLMLRGKCRHCGHRISPRYAVIEAVTGLGAVAVVLQFGPGVEGLCHFAFIATLIVVTFIDLDHRVIPNRITIPGIPIFFLCSLAVPVPTLRDAVLGVLVGGGSLYIVGWIYEAVTGKVGMGGGDIKLLAMIGAWTGWQGVLFTIYTASAVGTVVGLGVMVLKKKNLKLAIPFGPFLSLGAIAYVFFGTAIIRWYFYAF